MKIDQTFSSKFSEQMLARFVQAISCHIVMRQFCDKSISSFLRMIVVAEKSTVYKSFPIPLINRLEKHFLVMSTSLNERQRELSSIIYKWAEKFSTLKFGR